MGRRKGGLTDLLDLTSKLPWKVSAGLAPVSFVVLHLIANTFAHAAPAANLGDMGSVVIRSSVYVFAALFQYVLPLALLAGSAVAFARRHRANALLNGARSNGTTNIGGLSWRDFERVVGEGFRRRGFEVVERGGPAPDGGIDLVLTRGKERFPVQCKQWRAQQVGVSVVRELYGVMAAEEAAGGFVVTSGTFTKDARQFAAGRNVELIDGQGLDSLLRDGRGAESDVKLGTVEAHASENATPMCPRCRSPMVMRTAKKGRNVGGSFWGCAQYPKCRHTVAT
jgi:restriction system protein